MKNKLLLFFLIFSLLLFQNLHANIKDKIVAKIGNNVITNYDIINEINTILALSNKPADKNDFKELQNIAFASLKKSLIKKAEVEKYKVTNYSQVDVNDYVSSLEQNLKLKDIDLKNHFKKYGANYDFFIKGVIINFKWNTLVYSLYKKELDVDEELIKSELSKQILKEKKIEEFNLSEIVIDSWDDKKLNKIQKSITENGFEKTATIFSNSVSSAQGGAIGWVASKSISNVYLGEILKLNPSQISKPIKINNNIVIIKLNDKRTLNHDNLDLVKIENNIIKKKKEEKLNIFSNSHYLNLEKKTYIEINE